jgi:NADPH-dependent curcumin reductase CurA
VRDETPIAGRAPMTPKRTDVAPERGGAELTRVLAGVNRQVRLAQRPDGLPGAETWAYTEEPLATPQDGQVLIEVTHLSLDPAMRNWIKPYRTYIEPVELDAVMRAPAAGRVIASADASLPEGSWVTGMLGVQQYALARAHDLLRVDPERAPIARYLGAAGLTGLTAYFGLLDIGKASAGETVVVSGAAGAVGSVAVQIAKLRGCHTIGIAGGPEKCQWLREGLGVDAAIDYKIEDVGAELRRLAPDRIDVYFDNVGGEILDLALAHLALHARVVICGAISQYNAASVAGPSRYLSLIGNRASMTGFLVLDFEDRYEEATQQLLSWVEEGRLEAREQVVVGTIDDFPETFLSLFSGANTGKLVLQLA